MVYPILKRTLGVYFGLYLRKANGIENLPKNGPFIIAANHESHFDSFLLGTLVAFNLNKQLFFLTRFKPRRSDKGLFSKVTLFMVRPLFINLFGCVPVLKKGGAVDACKSALRKRKIIGIYPEGKRNQSKTLLAPRTGVAAMALLSKAPVIPAGIVGSYKIFPIGAFLPRFKRAVINVGKPMRFDRYYNKTPNRKTLEKVTHQIMVEIGKLCGKRCPRRPFHFSKKPMNKARRCLRKLRTLSRFRKKRKS
ncbi:1-acyl-sn-glycerol-3-phosphate acyltransferase [Candidatus Woesearchaeota archaeon]|nr:1-acyl-sn-glycerol-3-phosphate acyltransferase [Candidatus Woesearchaeota archaeon]